MTFFLLRRPLLQTALPCRCVHCWPELYTSGLGQFVNKTNQASEKQKTGTRRGTAAATDTRHMEAFLGDTEESTGDSPGLKKSKLKSLKTRLFGKSKKAGETSRKLSQSAGDITAEELGSNEDLLCNPGVMASRALSHDSIFLADQALTTEAEPTRVLSQENVHGKIKALQEKLLQQKFHLGLPPMNPPIKRSKDETSRSEEDVQNQSEMTERHTTTQGNLNKVLSQMSANPVLPTLALTKSAPSKSTSPIDEVPLDFSAPAQFTPSLDTSAARHRLSVKPRNQRASSKKRHSTVDATSLISDLAISETLREEDGQPYIQEEPKREVVDLKPNETTSVLSEPTNPEPTSKTPGVGSSQQDIAILEKIPTVTTQILRQKSHRPADVMPRPHSSFIPSEVKGKSESSGNVEMHSLKETQNKTWTDIKTKTVFAEPKSASPGPPLCSTFVSDETDRTTAIKRPLPDSGSFHLSVSASKRKEEEERPRSGSFTGVCEAAWIKTGGKRLDTSFPNISPKVDLKPSGAPLNLGREKTWTIKDSLKKLDSARESKNEITGTGNAEPVKEFEQEENKTTFGIKLRSTSQSVRLRAEADSNEYSRAAATDEKTKHTSNNADQISKKTTCTTEETKPDVSTASSAASVSTKQTPTPLVHPPLGSAEAQPTQVKGVPQAPQGPQSHATSTEVSWMSMAMEKTKNLQNLFTSKFPRDLTGGKTVAPLQKTQDQTLSDTLTQNAKGTNLPLSDAAKTEIQQNKTPAQTVKQSLPSTSAQQNTPKASPFKEAQNKPTVSQPSSTEPVTQSVTQGNIWTSESPLRSVRHVESTLSSPQRTSQQPLWRTQSLKSTGLAVTPSYQDNTAECRTDGTHMEEPQQPVWGRSVSKKAAFLEKRAEWISSPPEEVKKKETLTPSEPPTQSKETKASVASETKHTESASKKIPEKSKEEKWPRKTPDPCSAPSPSSTPSSSLQSLSDNGELSWIELAKRKSMAWSDKTMD